MNKLNGNTGILYASGCFWKIDRIKVLSLGYFLISQLITKVFDK